MKKSIAPPPGTHFPLPVKRGDLVRNRVSGTVAEARGDTYKPMGWPLAHRRLKVRYWKPSNRYAYEIWLASNVELHKKLGDRDISGATRRLVESDPRSR